MSPKSLVPLGAITCGQAYVTLSRCRIPVLDNILLNTARHNRIVFGFDSITFLIMQMSTHCSANQKSASVNPGGKHLVCHQGKPP
jgi:hypothetical protein